MIYTVTFNPAIDYVIHADRFTPGTVNRSSREELYFGGKGINVSVILSRLGVQSVALGFIAGFTGDAIQNGLRDMGVTTDFVRLEQGISRINVKLKSGTETELNCTGPHIDAPALDALLSKLDVLTSSDTLVLAGSIPPSLPEDIYERILSRLADKGIRTAVDASGRLLLNVLKYRPFLIKPNHIELGELFGTELTDDAQIAEYARRLRDMGARNVLVSMAGDGALLIDEAGKAHRCGACSGTVKNSVGAGDSMLAGFLAGIDRGCEYALKLGTAAGGATAFSDGLAERSLIDELMQTL